MSLCPCGSGLELDACCGQYIEGKAKAPTAEALMRSRYTAHCLGEYQYLTDTTHPQFREDASADEIKEWSSMMTWEGLEIMETVDGGENDSTGEVKFSAHYSVQNVPQRNHSCGCYLCRVSGGRSSDVLSGRHSCGSQRGYGKYSSSYPVFSGRCAQRKDEPVENDE